MKQFLHAFILIIIALPSVQAQDIITKRTGEKVEAKVLEISTDEIKYKRYSNLEGPTYVVPKAEIMLIQYEDKTTEAFELTATSPALATATASAGAEHSVKITPVATAELGIQQYNRGQADASTFYEGYKTAGTVVLVTSLLSPLVGLVPAVATSSTPPKTHNLDVPYNQLMQNPDYATGYKKKARKIKSGKVWTNWAIGLGTNLVLALLIAGSAN
ncbi:hypothetical protein [Pontibacter sp. H249]|uniref:hypothetical protein n=1 Tax=Pontibacter sp. H249 TaxID=3133420 RepID=UPI0030C04979